MNGVGPDDIKDKRATFKTYGWKCKRSDSYKSES